MRPVAYFTSALVALAFATPAAADEPTEELAVPVEPSEIYGGETTAVCGWPTTVSMLGACTGTLVHPEVVIYAAHCGAQYNAVTLGESIDGPKRQVPTEFCRTFPGGGPGNGNDWAVCKLAQPQLDIPIVPILMGCETDVLKPGQPVTIVGYGNADNGPYGIKREVITTINNITNQNEASIGGGGKDSCQGDSGGPVYVQLEDGSWRVFGITSYGGACGGGGMYSMMHPGIEWFETETGIDLTPCHHADGSWMPTPACKGFPLEPGAGNSDWGTGCGGGPVGGQSVTCGAAACDEAADQTPPTVAILSPEHETQLDAPNMMDSVTTSISITAADNVGGCGVMEVELLINGKGVGGIDKMEPFEFNNVSFPTGCWEIGAKAIDWVGNEALAEPHTLCVNMEPPPPPEPVTTSDGDSDSGSGGGTGDTEGDSTGTTDSTSSPGGSSQGATPGPASGGPQSNPTEVTCDCQTDHDPRAGALLVLGLAMLRRRRRR